VRFPIVTIILADVLHVAIVIPVQSIHHKGVCSYPAHLLGAATELIRSGISGVFLKRDSAALLAQGIRDVMAGKVWLDQEQLQTALKTEAGTLPDNRTRRFTEREQQVLSCVFEGLANKEIAARIGVSESSVKATLQQLFSKTGVRTRSQLVRIVLEQHRDQL
jgi:two-component system nitrate/nitrite response regulator NarL